MSYARRNATNNPELQSARNKRAQQMRRVHDARVAGELKNASYESVLAHNRMVEAVEHLIQKSIHGSSQTPVLSLPIVGSQNGEAAETLASTIRNTPTLTMREFPTLTVGKKPTLLLQEPFRDIHNVMASTVKVNPSFILQTPLGPTQSVIQGASARNRLIREQGRPDEMAAIFLEYFERNSQPLVMSDLLKTLDKKQKEQLQLLHKQGLLEKFIEYLSKSLEDSKDLGEVHAIIRP